MKALLMKVMIAALSLPAVADDRHAPMDHTHHNQANSSSQQTATTRGIVKAIDLKKNTVTIAHAAVPSLRWPAMTMGFRASPEQLAGLKVNDQVEFEFTAEGMNATIVTIQAQP